MTEPIILYSKEGFIFKKNEKNNYNLSFKMENDHIIIPKIIDFNLVKLIYDLNNDIYEKVNLHVINETEAILNLLMMNLFEDLGLPQRFSYVHIKKYTEKNNIKFVSQTIKGERPEGMPIDAELMSIQNMICNCNIITNHKIDFSFEIIFENTTIIPTVAEKMVGLILFKIFKRVKQFIENVRM